ncbi:hypothetical protein DFH06DRAFT_1192696 [Mycena polygramma]|nr:hypothetical protein DFH06DRAFT_1192696 [Mycena polygramma]
MHAIVLEQQARTKGSSKSQVEQLIGESVSKITSLQSDITALEAVIAALVEVRDREHATVAALRHLIAPVHKLPVELLADVLILTIDPDSSIYVKEALRVTHICSHWRQVAHATPWLWVGPISINLDKSAPKNAYIDGFIAWLARSAPLSVPVSLLFQGDWDEIDPYSTEMVLAFAPRWRALQLMSRSAPFFARIARCQFDSLEELEIARGSSASSLSLSAPWLRKLKMPAETSFRLPWAQLTDLVLTRRFGQSPDDCLDMLAQCPNLGTASITTPGWSVLPPTRIDIVTLAHLHTLSFTFCREGEEAHCLPFFDSLSAPRLEELSLEFETGFVWIQTPFTAFQQRSSNITRLSFDALNITWDDLRTALLHTPALTHLVLKWLKAAINNALLRALSYTDGVIPLAPVLHDLTICGVFDEHELTEAIVSRWWIDTELARRVPLPAVARWTRIAIASFRTQLTKTFTDMIEARRREGLDVVDGLCW